MKRFFKGRGLGFYLMALAGLVAFLAALIYLIYSLKVSLFAWGIFLLLLAGFLTSVMALWLPYRFVPLFAPVFLALAFGEYLNNRATMFAYMATGVYGISGESGAIVQWVVAILVLNFLALLVSLVANFLNFEGKGGMSQRANNPA